MYKRQCICSKCTPRFLRCGNTASDLVDPDLVHNADGKRGGESVFVNKVLHRQHCCAGLAYLNAFLANVMVGVSRQAYLQGARVRLRPPPALCRGGRAAPAGDGRLLRAHQAHQRRVQRVLQGLDGSPRARDGAPVRPVHRAHLDVQSPGTVVPHVPHRRLRPTAPSRACCHAARAPGPLTLCGPRSGRQRACSAARPRSSFAAQRSR